MKAAFNTDVAFFADRHDSYAKRLTSMRKFCHPAALKVCPRELWLKAQNSQLEATP
jgi:hypothetical protein